MTSRSEAKAPPPHPLFIVGMLAIPLSVMWSPLLILAPCCLGRWALKIEKPRRSIVSDLAKAQQGELYAFQIQAIGCEEHKRLSKQIASDFEVDSDTPSKRASGGTEG